MNLIAIKTLKGYYVSDNVDDKSYFTSDIMAYLYDVRLQKTYHKEWFSCEALPTVVYKKHPSKYINSRWELKDGYAESKLTPKLMTEVPDEEISALYEYRSEKIEGLPYEEIVETTVIVEQTEFEIRQIEYNVSHNLIDKITTPSVLLVNKATKISSVESFAIIRAFVKKHIDKKCAVIHSDYDFKLKVDKIVYHEPEEHKSLIRGRRVVEYRRNRFVTILELETNNNGRVSNAPAFEGINYDDCIDNLNKYLEWLRIEITTPLTECPYCKGSGIVI